MTSRAPRATPNNPQSKTRLHPVVVAGAALAFVLAAGIIASSAPTQETGDIAVPSHWSPYSAPTSYPEGSQIHIIVRDDTLWDLANQYLENPFLWPQLWDANRYIQNPNLIYPGDPVLIPDLDVLRGEGEEPGAPGSGPGTGPGELPTDPGATGQLPGGGGPRGPSLFPAYEEASIQCAGYVSDPEDESLRIIGSEEGDAKWNLTIGDILYVNAGTNDGINPGDQFYLQRREHKLTEYNPHINTGGWHVVRSGWVSILASQDDTSIAEVVHACTSINQSDYLTPFDPVPVPLLPRLPTANRFTPETGQTRGRIVASLEDVTTLGEGYLVALDVGERDGLIPGNIMVVYRYLYDGVPRKVLGEVAILTVREKTSMARIMKSLDFMDVGDLVEMK